MSQVTKNVMLDSDTFASMGDLRYLKFYNSRCPKVCESECTVNFPDGVEFTLQEIRYLHWLKFPLDELPPDFNPENLIDLRLPYNKIQRVWEAIKVCLHVPSFALIHFFLWSRLFQMKKIVYIHVLNKSYFHS